MQDAGRLLPFVRFPADQSDCSPLSGVPENFRSRTPVPVSTNVPMMTKSGVISLLPVCGRSPAGAEAVVSVIYTAFSKCLISFDHCENQRSSHNHAQMRCPRFRLQIRSPDILLFRKIHTSGPPENALCLQHNRFSAHIRTAQLCNLLPKRSRHCCFPLHHRQTAVPADQRCRLISCCRPESHYCARSFLPHHSSSEPHAYPSLWITSLPRTNHPR